MRQRRTSTVTQCASTRANGFITGPSSDAPIGSVTEWRAAKRPASLVGARSSRSRCLQRYLRTRVQIGARRPWDLSVGLDSHAARRSLLGKELGGRFGGFGLVAIAPL
jgi:hypothetical protein